MRQFSRRAIIAVVVILVAAGIFSVRRARRSSHPEKVLTTTQRIEIMKSVRFSRAGLTSESPEVAQLRARCKGANVVICVIDAARADHFGCYGYPRPTTPNIDRLARESWLFEDHFCQFPSTLPSTESLFSSQYPDTHGISDPTYETTDENGGIRINVPREPSFTFPIGLEALGYKTVLLTGSGRASPTSGIGLGFSEGYYHHSLEPFIHRDERRYTPAVLLRVLKDWLDKRSTERFFMYIHFGPPHRPYEQPARYTRLFEGQVPPGFVQTDYSPGKYLFPLRVKQHHADRPPVQEWINLYDANLRYGDWAIGEVRKLLEKHGICDKTLLIITSDHGEGFGEHGFVWHSQGIYAEASHIPLLMKLPGGAGGGRRVGALTETIDLLPTVYDLLNAPFPTSEVQGKSLLPLLTGSKQKVHDFSVTRSDDPPKWMIRDQQYSLLIYQNPKWRALYDTAADPQFRHNILAEKPHVAAEVYNEFLRFANAQRHPPREFPGVTARQTQQRTGRKITLTPDMKDELRSLGYLK